MSKMVSLPHLPSFLWLIPAAALIFFSSGCSLARHNYALPNSADSPASVYVLRTPLSLPASPAPEQNRALNDQFLNLAQCI